MTDCVVSKFESTPKPSGPLRDYETAALEGSKAELMSGSSCRRRLGSQTRWGYREVCLIVSYL